MRLPDVGSLCDLRMAWWPCSLPFEGLCPSYQSEHLNVTTSLFTSKLYLLQMWPQGAFRRLRVILRPFLKHFLAPWNTKIFPTHSFLDWEPWFLFPYWSVTTSWCLLIAPSGWATHGTWWPLSYSAWLWLLTSGHPSVASLQACAPFSFCSSYARQTCLSSALVCMPLKLLMWTSLKLRGLMPAVLLSLLPSPLLLSLSIWLDATTQSWCHHHGSFPTTTHRLTLETASHGSWALFSRGKERSEAGVSKCLNLGEIMFYLEASLADYKES